MTVAGATVNRFCSSGLQAIALAAHQIINEGVDAAIGGGVESITAIAGRRGEPNPWVKEHKPGIYMVMGDTAEVVAKRYNISRQAQDEYSLVEPAAHRAGPGRGLLRRRAGADDASRAAFSTRKPAKSSARKSTRSRKTSATGPTRRSKVCWRSSPISIPTAARAA